jgi:cathepsin B
MFRSLVLLAVLTAIAYCSSPKDVPEEVRKLTGDALVEHINKQGKWQAKSYPKFAGKSKEELKRFLGALKKPGHLRRKGQAAPAVAKSDAAPPSFDAVQNWPQCADIIGLIQDQSACGSCWAVSTTSAMSDRLCIASNGQIRKSISALDLMACCDECGYQCDGGWPDEAWNYFTETGIVTGDNYTADTGCKPYPIAPCWLSGGQINCPDEPSSDFSCKQSCQTSYKDEPYNKDSYFGSSTLYFSNQNDDVIQELITNGPVVAAFDVYEDFYSYTGGIYEYQGGDYVGGHAVRIVGYGTENGVDYWKVANSWDTFWGEDGGYFRIVRGTNDCEFESEITSGAADVARSQKNK